jgi:hypothetical protein
MAMSARVRNPFRQAVCYGSAGERIAESLTPEPNAVAKSRLS